MERCPACEATAIDHEPSTGLKHCQACDHVWEAATVPVRRGTFRVGHTPPGVSASPRGEGVEIRLSWLQAVGPKIHALWLAILLPVFASPTVGGLLFSAAMFAVWFAFLRNDTVVVVQPDGVTVRHEPVPTPVSWAGFVGPEQLAQLELATRRQTARYGKPGADDEVYTLRAGGTDLLQWWSEPATLRYVQNAIRAIVDVSHVAPVDDLSGMVPQRTPPEGVRVRRDGDTVVLELPWNAHSSPAALHLLWLFILPGLFAGGGATLVGLVIFALWLYLSVNTTEVRISPTGVRIQHGPIPHPLFPSLHLGPAQALALHTDTTRWQHLRGGATTFHHLETGTDRVLAFWLDPSKPRYVEACIRHRLG